jgi:protein-tyrosine phosphatase
VYDLHAHILPGVDDGAETIEETLEMARVAAQSGTRFLLATPHRRDVTESSSVASVRDLLDEVNIRVREQNTELTLVLGMENHLDLELPDEVTAGRALPIGDTRYILVEMPFVGRPMWVEDVLYRLQLQGLTPVLAHPERIETFQHDPELLLDLVERGMLSQITAGSAIGVFGRSVQRFTAHLLRRNLVHVMSSDTHGPTGPRSPNLGPGIAALTRLVGEVSTMAMVMDTPRAILEDRPVEVDPPRSYESIRHWWQFRKR